VILEAFQDIWGNDVLVSVGSDPSSSKKMPIKKRRPFPTDSMEPEKWQMTVFFLEISQDLSSNFLVPLATLLDRALNQQEQSDHAYVLDLLISKLLDITDHLTMEVSKICYYTFNTNICIIYLCPGPSSPMVLGGSAPGILKIWLFSTHNFGQILLLLLSFQGC
jgi:uncharacterized protein YqcC (DUF446 family)